MYPDVKVSIVLSNLHCYDEDDGPGDAEPYLWTIFYKIDGDSIRVDAGGKLQGVPTVVTSPGAHGNLGVSGVGAGQNVPITPAIGKYETVLKPIPVDPALAPVVGPNIPGFVGLIAVLLEEDNVPDDGADAGHNALNDAFRTAINAFIAGRPASAGAPTPADVNALKKQVIDAVKPAIIDSLNAFELIWAAINIDDQIGVLTDTIWNSTSFTDAQPTTNVGRRWKKEGDWELQGWITGELPFAPNVRRVTHANGPGHLYLLAGVDQAGAPWQAKVQQVVADIKRGSRYYTDEGGHVANVYIFNYLSRGRPQETVSTLVDNTKANNLHSLPPIV